MVMVKPFIVVQGLYPCFVSYLITDLFFVVNVFFFVVDNNFSAGRGLASFTRLLSDSASGMPKRK